MTGPLSESHLLHRWFRGFTESTFMHELGIGDPSLVGYLSDLLARFVQSERIWGLRDAEGRRCEQVAEMLGEAESTVDNDRRRECLRHVGDFTSFWTGVYPEALRTLQGPTSADHLIEYQAQGKRSYYLASTLESSSDAPVLRRLSFEFELCAFGLSRVRREWERFEAESSKSPSHIKFSM